MVLIEGENFKTGEEWLDAGKWLVDFLKEIKTAERTLPMKKVNSLTILLKYSKDITKWEKSVMLFEIQKLRSIGKSMRVLVSVEGIDFDNMKTGEYLMKAGKLGKKENDQRVLLYLTDSEHVENDRKMSVESRKMHEELNENFDRISMLELENKSEVSVEELIF